MDVSTHIRVRWVTEDFLTDGEQRSNGCSPAMAQPFI